MKAKMIIATLALFVSIGLSAQTPQKSTAENRKSCYVDKNKNGICDKKEDGTCKIGNGKGLQDGSGRGAGRGCGKRNGSGRANGGKAVNFVDKNKNGICDNNENTVTKTK